MVLKEGHPVFLDTDAMIGNLHPILSKKKIGNEIFYFSEWICQTSFLHFFWKNKYSHELRFFFNFRGYLTVRGKVRLD